MLQRLNLLTDSRLTEVKATGCLRKILCFSGHGENTHRRKV